ncbi:MAG: AMP nucleosidase, partial [Hyphomicrobiales bacterium]
MPTPRSYAIVDELDQLYRASVGSLRHALSRYIDHGERPDEEARRAGAFAYPELRLFYGGSVPSSPPLRAFGRLTETGHYAVDVTQPALFRDYLASQIDFLVDDYGATVSIARGRQEIPYPYVLDAGHNIDLTGAAAVELARIFPANELAHIGDEVVDGYWMAADRPRPLALFDAQRTDFSLARLRHYTGTPTAHVQNYILFTNYHRYVDEFVRWGVSQLSDDGPYRMLSCAGGLELGAGANPEDAITDSAWRRHQMPAYHLVGPD